MSRVAITSENSAAIGPYSHGIDTGHLVFLSGQTPIDPATGTLVDSDIGAQTRQCLDNLSAVLTRPAYLARTSSSATSFSST